MSYELDKIILDSLNESADFNDNYIGSEHILLAILSDKKLYISQLLKCYGITYEKIKRDIYEINYVSCHEIGYSKVVHRLLNSCNDATSIISFLIEDKDNFACYILNQNQIIIDKIIN